MRLEPRPILQGWMLRHELNGMIHVPCLKHEDAAELFLGFRRGTVGGRDFAALPNTRSTRFQEPEELLQQENVRWRANGRRTQSIRRTLCFAGLRSRHRRPADAAVQQRILARPVPRPNRRTTDLQQALAEEDES